MWYSIAIEIEMLLKMKQVSLSLVFGVVVVVVFAVELQWVGAQKRTKMIFSALNSCPEYKIISSNLERCKPMLPVIIYLHYIYSSECEEMAVTSDQPNI